MPCVHSPPNRRHRLGMRGHAGTAASSTGRKWVWFQSRCRALLAVCLSQQPVQQTKKYAVRYFSKVEQPQWRNPGFLHTFKKKKQNAICLTFHQKQFDLFWRAPQSAPDIRMSSPPYHSCSCIGVRVSAPTRLNSPLSSH